MLRKIIRLSALSVCLTTPIHSFQPATQLLRAGSTTPTTSRLILHSSMVNGLSKQQQVNTNNTITTATTTLESSPVQQLTSRLLQDPVQKSSIVAAACVATWALVPTFNIIQASSVVGLASCVLFPTNIATAAFCGSFAGMSAQTGTSLAQASLLGICNSLVYYWWTDQKLQLGKGGRLGTMAFLGSLFYFVLKEGALVQVLRQVVEIVSPQVAFVLLGCSCLMAWLRHVGSLGKTKTPLVRVANIASRVAVLGALLLRYISLSTSSETATLITTKLLPAVFSTFAASLAVKKSPGVVLPVAALGLVAGTVLPAALAAPVYMGAFLGMTGLAGFGAVNFLWASTLSTVLLQLGLFNGFGGKLGFLAFVGVNFAM